MPPLSSLSPDPINQCKLHFYPKKRTYQIVSNPLGMSIVLELSLTSDVNMAISR